MHGNHCQIHSDLHISCSHFLLHDILLVYVFNPYKRKMEIVLNNDVYNPRTAETMYWSLKGFEASFNLMFQGQMYIYLRIFYVVGTSGEPSIP